MPPSSEWQSPSIPTRRQPTWLVQDHFMLYGSSDRHDESTVLPSPNVEAVHRKRKKGAVVVERWLAYLPCKLIKVAPENWWLEDDSFILGGALFSGATFVSGRVNVAFDEKEEVAWKNLTYKWRKDTFYGGVVVKSTSWLFGLEKWLPPWSVEALGLTTTSPPPTAIRFRQKRLLNFILERQRRQMKAQENRMG